MKVLLHASDIGAGVRPFAINEVLSKRVHVEFQVRADPHTVCEACNTPC
jgi:hypothetical protein